MQVEEVLINQIFEGYHPRKDSKGLEELREQIQRDGLREPLRVRPENDRFVIIDGNRRFSVLKELGYETVPCIIEDIDERNAAHQSYLLNSKDCRKNLNPIEVSLHIKEMRERFGYSVQDLINLGYAKDDQTIYNKLSLLTLPKEIQDKIAEGDVSPTIGYELARKLSRSEDKDRLLRSFDHLCAKRDLSVSKFKKRMRDLIDSGSPQKDKGEPVLQIPEGDLPGVFFKDSSDMSDLADESVGLVVTSPPYWVGMEYEEGVSFEDHLRMLDRALSECVRVLVPGGKICVNFGDIHNFGSRNRGKPEIKLMGHHYQEILGRHGLRLIDTIIWKKCTPDKRNFNWCANPQANCHEETRHTSYRIINNTEHIYVFEKNGRRNVSSDLEKSSRISKEEEYDRWNDGVWEIPPVKGENGHPAPFPEELPRRLIKMYSYKEDIVLDCFGGTMTTLKVARELDRVGIGYEKDEKYKSAIMRKLGIKVEDLKKSEKLEVHAGLTDEEEREAKKTLVNDILPAIVADAAAKGEKIAMLTVPIKRNLTKVDVEVETVPGDDDPPPTSPMPLLEVVRPDDYEEPNQSRINRVQALSSLPSVKPDNSILLNTIVHGDAFEVIKTIEDESVDLWITSPPYAAVKSYGEDVKIVSPDEYVDWILPLMEQIHRTLKRTGSLILNMNDCVVNKQRHPFVHELIFRSTKETHLKLYDTYFWIKKGTLPTGNEKRLNNWTEYLIHFTKDESAVKWNMDAVREPYDANTISRCKYPVNTFNMEVDEKGRPKQRGRRIISLNPKGKRPSNVFSFPTAAAVRDKKHPAAFHIDLPSWFIKALTDEGDVVADVFAGSGTTCLAAKTLNRKFIGIELNPEYQKCAQEKVRKVAFAIAA
jgi:ParB/RepB/Spo0J family partition protein